MTTSTPPADVFVVVARDRYLPTRSTVLAAASLAIAQQLAARWARDEDSEDVTLEWKQIDERGWAAAEIQMDLLIVHVPVHQQPG